GATLGVNGGYVRGLAGRAMRRAARWAAGRRHEGRALAAGPSPEPGADQKTAWNGGLPKVASGTSTVEATKCSSGAPRSSQQRPRVVMKVEHVLITYSLDLTVRVLPG